MCEDLINNVDYFISVSGPLSVVLCGLSHVMDLLILEGYGLTETAPVVETNVALDQDVVDGLTARSANCWFTDRR